MKTYTEAAVQTLNEFLRLDAEAMNRMMQLSTPVNRAIVDHPTIIVHEPSAFVSFPVCRFLGLLNGIAHKIDPSKTITAVYGEDGRLEKFEIRGNPTFTVDFLEKEGIITKEEADEMRRKPC